MKTDSRRDVEVGFSLIATRCLVLRLDLGPIIPRTIETRWGAISVCMETRDLGNCRAANDFYRKKSLPCLVISGIPRARAETTNLLSTGNCISFGDFQRGRAGAGAGAVHVGGRQSQR